MPVLIMARPALFTCSTMTHPGEVSCVIQRVIAASPSFAGHKLRLVTHDTLPGKIHSMFLRMGVRVCPRVRTRICTKSSVTSVISVIFRGEMAVTLAVTLPAVPPVVSLGKGGPHHA